MMESGLTASDVLALTRNEETDMWNNPFVYLVWIWAFSAFGGGGFGFGRGDAQGALTRSDLFEGFNTQEINGQLRGITNGLCDGFYGLNSSLLSGFNALGAQVAENRFAAQNCCLVS